MSSFALLKSRAVRTASGCHRAFVTGAVVRLCCFVGGLLMAVTVPHPLSAEEKQDIIGPTWLTANGNSAFKFYRCAEDKTEVCGKVVWTRRLIDPETALPFTDEPPCEEEYCGQKLLGMELIRGLEPSDDADRAEWNDGRIYDPNSAKIYSIRIRRKGDELHLRGYVGLTLFGRTTIWNKADVPPVEDSTKMQAGEPSGPALDLPEDPSNS